MPTKINEETLNGICPYFTMFPLSFPNEILRESGQNGGWVLDPFCGRGTTNYAARLSGFNTIGIDSNPAAIAIASAKSVSCHPSQIIETAKEILDEVRVPQDIPEGEFWDWAYHPQVLNELSRIREGLLVNCNTDLRKALRGIMLGALHGHVLKTTASYFSNQCQRTYSPKPAYAVRYWQRNNLYPPQVDVLAIIKKRAERFYSCVPSAVKSIFIHGDSRHQHHYENTLEGLEVDWIITSPPYYGMKSYLPDQWLRLWFVGANPKVDYDKSSQLKHTGTDTFANELGQVWTNIRKVAKHNTKLVIRFGGIPSVKSDPLNLLEKSLEGTGWTKMAVKSAGFSSDGHRQAYQQAKNQNPPVEEFDFWASVE